MPVQRTCLRCAAAFTAIPSQVHAGKAKYCSRACANLASRGAGASGWKGGRPYLHGGYLRFWNPDGSDRFVHRVVWEAAHGPIPPDHVVHHVNGDKTDNRLENLTLLAHGEHSRLHAPTRRIAQGERHGEAKLTVDAVRAIRTRYAAGGVTLAQLGAEYGVHFAQVGKIVRRTSWAHVP